MTAVAPDYDEILRVVQLYADSLNGREGGAADGPDPSAQAKLGLAEAMLNSARAYLYERVQARWEQVLGEDSVSIEQKAELLLAATHAMQTSAKVVELMYGVAGISAIYSRNPLERHFRDIQVLKQHGFYSESRYETVGQVLFGRAARPGLCGFLGLPNECP